MGLDGFNVHGGYHTQLSFDKFRSVIHEICALFLRIYGVEAYVHRKLIARRTDICSTEKLAITNLNRLKHLWLLEILRNSCTRFLN